MDMPSGSNPTEAPTPTNNRQATNISPDWVLEQHRNQQELNAQIMEALRAIQEYQQITANSFIPQRRTLPPLPPQNVIVPEPEPYRKARHSLAHPDKYDGESRIEYLSFKGLLRAKLRIDAVAIGGEPEQVWYGYGRLTGKAAARIFPWLDATERKRISLQVKAFFEELDAAFHDPQTAQRALVWINTRKQGVTPFREFLQTFEQKLLEAGGILLNHYPRLPAYPHEEANG